MEVDKQIVPVIIPMCNRPEYGMACLESIYSTPHGARIAPIVVNCGSRPKTVKLVQEWIGRHAGLSEDVKSTIQEPRVVHLPVNKGFSNGINAGLLSIEKIEEKSICILHNDTVVFPGWMGHMLSAFQEDDDVGVVVPRTSYANEMSPCDAETRKQFEALKPSNKDRIATEDLNTILTTLYGNDRSAFVAKIAEKNQRPYTFSPEISSFCMLTKGEHFAKYGKFDEDFWLRGYEDKLWFRALERDGYICMIANSAYVHHFGNVTSDGPGFSFPEIMKVNEEKFKAKCLEKDKSMGQTPAQTK